VIETHRIRLLDRWPICDRICEGHAELDDVYIWSSASWLPVRITECTHQHHQPPFLTRYRACYQHLGIRL